MKNVLAITASGWLVRAIDATNILASRGMLSSNDDK